jgi:hypothetical protein
MQLYISQPPTPPCVNYFMSEACLTRTNNKRRFSIMMLVNLVQSEGYPIFGFPVSPCKRADAKNCSGSWTSKNLLTYLEAPNVNTQRYSFSHRPSVRRHLATAIMPRSATDATRFTSTTPHASAKLPPKTPANAGPPRTPGPPGETPQEKVKRLRAAADRARNAQVSNFDKVVSRGRVWADRAHRFTALSLIGITRMLNAQSLHN